MKERPILLNTDMVQALMSGRKHMTRRIRGLEDINEIPDEWIRSSTSFVNEQGLLVQCLRNTFNEINHPSICPYGMKGDILWVRETFCEPILHDGLEDDYYYRADEISAVDVRRSYISGKWKPNIFMPKSACRFNLIIKNILCDQLKNISPEDAVREGIEPIHQYAADIMKNGKLYKDYSGKQTGLSAIDSFLSLWASINGQKSVDHNPWVWVIEFEVKRIK